MLGTADRILVLNMVNQDSILGILYGLLNPPGLIPELGINFWNPRGVAHKQSQTKTTESIYKCKYSLRKLYKGGSNRVEDWSLNLPKITSQREILSFVWKSLKWTERSKEEKD